MSLRHVTSVFVALAMLSAFGAFASEASTTSRPALRSPLPEIHIISPVNGAKLSAHDLDLEFHVANFTLNESAMGGANVAGEGHVHVLIDESEVGMTASTHFHQPDVAIGVHKILVRLHNNDHSLLDPVVADEVDVEFEGPHLSLGHPEDSAEVNTFEVEVEFHVERFTLEEPRQQPNSMGHGHIRWRVLKDGLPVTANPEILWKSSHTHAELKASGCTFAKCVYVLEAWLANNDGSMVDGTEKHTATFTVLPPNFAPVFGIFISFFILMGVGILWAFRRQAGEKKPKLEEETIKGLE